MKPLKTLCSNFSPPVRSAVTLIFARRCLWEAPMSYNYSGLNPDKALIWRITHRENLPWLLRHGLHAGNGLPCPDWISIGNAELTTRRGERVVPLPPGG